MTKSAEKVIKMKKKADRKKTVADFLRAVSVCEAVDEMTTALEKIETQIQHTRDKHQQLLMFKAEVQKRLKTLKKEPGQ